MLRRDGNARRPDGTACPQQRQGSRGRDGTGDGGACPSRGGTHAGSGAPGQLTRRGWKLHPLWGSREPGPVCDPPVGASIPDDSLWMAPGLQLCGAGLRLRQGDGRL